MRRHLRTFSIWRRDLRRRPVEWRDRQPGLLVAIVVAFVALIALIMIPVLGIGGESPPLSRWTERSVSATADTDRPVRYVPYNGLAQSRSQDAGDVDALPAQLNGSSRPDVVLPRLSDVLRDRYDESDLTYGSDGAEGSLLPLDNGVVPSSGPRFRTNWQLIVPSAGIRAAVVQVGLTIDGAMGSPDNPFVVGWFNRSARPGQPGNALLGGHRDYQDINGNVGVGVCWELDETRVGDQLVMHERETDRYYVYDVVERATVRPESRAAVKYLSQTLESVLTLITCSGDFDEATHSYDQRIVIVALLNAVARPDA